MVFLGGQWWGQLVVAFFLLTSAQYMATWLLLSVHNNNIIQSLVGLVKVNSFWNFVDGCSRAHILTYTRKLQIKFSMGDPRHH